MKVIEIYACPRCKKQYTTKEEATECMNSNNTPKFEVGNIVELKYGYGWFDGDKRWVINPDVDMSKHGFGEDCSMGFYYVITVIKIVDHEVRYYVATNAMTGESGHNGGWTADTHYPPKLIDAPKFVVKDSKKLIGKKIKWLL